MFLKTLEQPVGSLLIKQNSPDHSYFIFNKRKEEGHVGTAEDKRQRMKWALSQQEAQESFLRDGRGKCHEMVLKSLLRRR